MRNSVVEEVKAFIREPFAFPGGYPKVLIMSDRCYMCAKCAKENYRLISDSTRHDNSDGWGAAGVQINWEDTDAQCANCNATIESAYGEDNGND